MKQNLLTHIMRLTILFLLFFGGGTGSAVGATGLECGDATPTKPTALAADLADPAVGPALLDFLSGNTAGITAAARVNRLKAWEVAFKSQAVRTDPSKLTKLRQWLDNGLDEAKLTKAFDDAPDGVTFFNKLDGAKSHYHQQVHIKDFDNIPGVQKTNYTPNGLTSGKTNPNWNNPDLDLPASEAANFTNAVAKDLPEGSKIYRVTGGNPAGGYWTSQIPNEVGDVIGGTAVRPEWNSFEKFYEFEVPPGGLKVWEGGTARQRVTDGVDDYLLPGGDQQIFVPQVLRDQNFANAVNEIPLPW